MMAGDRHSVDFNGLTRDIVVYSRNILNTQYYSSDLLKAYCSVHRRPTRQLCLVREVREGEKVVYIW